MNNFASALGLSNPIPALLSLRCSSHSSRLFGVAPPSPHIGLNRWVFQRREALKSLASYACSCAPYARSGPVLCLPNSRLLAGGLGYLERGVEARSGHGAPKNVYGERRSRLERSPATLGLGKRPRERCPKTGPAFDNTKASFILHTGE